MDVEERALHELHRRLDQVLGEEHAMTLMRQLPQGPVASRQDVELSEQRLDAKIGRIDQRLDAKIDGVEQRLTATIHEVVGGLHEKMGAQVRTYTFATIGALLTLAVIAFGAAGLI